MAKADKPAQLTEEQELAVLFPEPEAFKVGNITIEILPMDTATCVRFARKANPILRQALFEAQAGGKVTTEGGPKEWVENLMPEFVVAAADHPDEFVEAMSLAIGKPLDFVGRLPPAATLALAAKVLEINSSFFALTAASLASGGRGTEAAAGTGGDGRTP